VSGLEWTRPEWWPALLALPVVYALLMWSLRGRLRRSRAYGVASADRDGAPWARAARITLLLGCCTLAWMDPLWGEEQVAVERRGLDVIVCVDVSRSMLARDLSPDRLGRARQDVQSLLDELRPGDRVGLVVFSGVPRLKAPLTHDRASVGQLVLGLGIDDVRIGGTDLAAAVRRALELVEEGAESSSAVVLLTDGEELAGAASEAAAEAAARGVVLHAVGYGSIEGSKILDPDRSGGFVVDDQGREVVTVLDADGLRRMAESTGGEFLRADTAALPLVELVRKRLHPMVRRLFEEGEEARPKTRYQWVLLPAIALLVLEIVLAGGRRGPRRRAVAPGPVP